MTSIPKKYNLPMRINHWVLALIIISLIAVGWFMTGLDKEVSYRGDIYAIHKSFGVLVIFLVAIRIIFRLASKLPNDIESFKKYENILAKLTYFTFYILMIIIPLSGYVMSDAGGHPIKFFNITMPDLFETNKKLAGTAHKLHGIFPYILLALIILHIAAAVKHLVIDKVNLFKRMI